MRALKLLGSLLCVFLLIVFWFLWGFVDQTGVCLPWCQGPVTHTRECTSEEVKRFDSSDAANLQRGLAWAFGELDPRGVTVPLSVLLTVYLAHRITSII